MFNPIYDGYERNERGLPDYASIILTIDSVSANAPGNDVVQKMVLSTQDAAEALRQVFDYYGEHEIMHRAQTLRQFMAAGREEHPIYIYQSKVNCEIILSVATWQMLVEHPSFGNSSNLLAAEKLQEVAANAMNAQLKATGELAPFVVTSFELGEAPVGGEKPVRDGCEA